MTDQCANPACTNPVHRTGRPGRPPLYCPNCRTAPRRSKPDRRLRVELDHEPDLGPGRPTGRVWLIRLAAGDHTVTIADHLGRTTAQDLAARLNQLLTAHRQQPPHPTD